MSILDPLIVAGDMLDSAEIRGCSKGVEDNIKHFGVYDINPTLAFAGYYVEGGRSCRELFAKFVNILGIVGEESLREDCSLSISAFHQFLPLQGRPLLDKSEDLWMVGYMVQRSLIDPQTLAEMDECSHSDFSLENFDSLNAAIKTFPDCFVNVLWGLEDDSLPNMEDPVIAIHGLSTIVQANHVAKELLVQLAANNRIIICSPQAVGAVLDFKLKGNYAVISRRFSLKYYG